MNVWDDSDSSGDESVLVNREPLTLAREIQRVGPRHYLTAQTRERFANIDRQTADAEIYGQQDTGPYSMENFIIAVLELDMNTEDARRAIQWDETAEYIIDKALEAININPNKKEIQFTPQDNSEYSKIKTIYDKLASDLRKMICLRLKLSPCPSNNKVIQMAQEMYPDIRFEDGMSFGYKLKAIEDYLSANTKAEAKGRRRKSTRRRSGSKKRRTVNRKRYVSRRRTGNKKRITSKRM